MPVLIEAISVVIRADRLEEALPGGFAELSATVPECTICSDGDLVRVCFLHSEDADTFIDWLGRYGLRHLVDNRAHDIVVIDQRYGPMGKCDWIECGEVSGGPSSPRRVRAARRAGSRSTTVVTPVGWTFERSLSACCGGARQSAAEVASLGRRDASRAADLSVLACLDGKLPKTT